jgi:hypothetical protein
VIVYFILGVAMRVLIMLVTFVMVFCVSCDDAKDISSGEIYCDALLNCADTGADQSLTYSECVDTYDSNPCVAGEEGSCYRVFSDSEKDCLLQFDACGFWENYESCLVN